MRERVTLSLIVITLGGCAAQPAPPPETHQVKVDVTNVVAAQQAGYKLVNKDGQQVFCRTDFVTGSHVQTSTSCLTPQELQNQMDNTQNALGQMAAHSPGPVHK